jgi:hypothetical protein
LVAGIDGALVAVIAVRGRPADAGTGLAGVPVSGGLTQPSAESQLSAVHWLPSVQSGGAPPVQTPLTQESLVVQASESLQAAPLVLLVF